MLALAVEHVPPPDAKDHPPERCDAQSGRRLSSNGMNVIFQVEEQDRSTLCFASIDSMKRVARPVTCFFRRKNNVYRPYDARRTSGRRCSSTWKKGIGPAYASRLPMGSTTSDDRSSTSPEWEKIVVHVEEPHRTCAQVAACDGVHRARRRIVHVFRAGEDVLPAGRRASDAPTHHGPRWCAPRWRTHRARLPASRAVSSGRMHRDVRPEGAMPPRVVGVTPTQERLP
jgi:hypothetical protein